MVRPPACRDRVEGEGEVMDDQTRNAVREFVRLGASGEVERATACIKDLRVIDVIAALGDLADRVSEREEKFAQSMERQLLKLITSKSYPVVGDECHGLKAKK
jgi:hypothetical protein